MTNYKYIVQTEAMTTLKVKVPDKPGYFLKRWYHDINPPKEALKLALILRTEIVRGMIGPKEARDLEWERMTGI